MLKGGFVVGMAVVHVRTPNDILYACLIGLRPMNSRFRRRPELFGATLYHDAKRWSVESWYIEHELTIRQNRKRECGIADMVLQQTLSSQK